MLLDIIRLNKKYFSNSSSRLILIFNFEHFPQKVKYFQKITVEILVLCWKKTFKGDHNNYNYGTVKIGNIITHFYISSGRYKYPDIVSNYFKQSNKQGHKSFKTKFWRLSNYLCFALFCWFDISGRWRDARIWISDAILPLLEKRRPVGHFSLGPAGSWMGFTQPISFSIYHQGLPCVK